MNKISKVFVWVLAVVALAGFGKVADTQAAAQAGSLIKMNGLSSVYYLGADGKRYVFPNQSTYFSWYKDFSGVVTISQSELESYPLGANITMRPGTKLVKITTSPKVYAVEPGGTLRAIPSEASAKALYGDNWAKRVVDVADAFFTNYKQGNGLAENEVPAGSLVKNAGNASVYYFDGSNYRQIANEAAFNANRFSFDNVMTISNNITAGGNSVTANEFANPDSSATNVGTQPGQGTGLTVALSSNTPASASIPTGAVNVPYVKVNLTASNDGPVTVNYLTFTRTGIGSANDFVNVYLYDGNTRLTTGRSVNASTNKVSFTGLNYVIPAGQTKTLTLTADINTAGNNNAFGIAAASDLAVSGVSVSGAFPVMGNIMNIVSQSTGSITIAKTGSLTNPKLGEQNAKIAEFNLTAGSVEDLSVEGLTLYQLGNISNSNLTNFVLKQAGNTIATAANVNSNNNIVFNFNSVYSLEKGTTKTFEVYANIGTTARASDTIKVYLDNASDLLARGKTYGYGVQVNRGNYDNGAADGSDASWTSIEAGQITISYKGPAVTDYSVQGTDVELFRFDINSQNNVEIRNTHLNLAALTSDEGGLVKKTGIGPFTYAANYTDVKFVDVATGQVIAGPKDVVATAAASDTTQDIEYTDTWNLTAGQTKTIKVTADIANFTPAGAETIKATLNPFGSSDIKNLDNNLFIAATDIVPTTAIVGSNHYVKSGSATISKAGTPSVQTYINGAADVAMTGINLTAGTGKDIKVTSIKLTASGNADEAGAVHSCNTESNCVLTVKLFDGNTQVGETKSLSGTTVTFNNLNLNITKGTTKTLVAKASLNTLSSVIAGTTLGLNVVSANDITSQDSDGNNITMTGTVTGPAHTILGAGTINATIAPDEVNLTESRIILAGNSDETLAKFKFNATNEDLKLTKVRINLSANTSEEVASLALYDGSTKITSDVVPTQGATIYADFNSFTQDFVIAKDSSKTLTVKANMNSVSNGATSGTVIVATLDAFNNFEVRGVNSNTVISGIDINAGGAFDAGDVINGRNMTLRKTKVTLTENSINSAIVNASENEVYSATIAADAKEDASVRQMRFAVSLNDNVGTDNTLTAKGWKVYRNGADITSLVTLTDDDGAIVVGGNETEEGDTFINVLFNDEVVAKGSSNTYTLRATLGGYNVGADDDTITVRLNSDTDLADTTNTAAGVIAEAGKNNFVWSDNSASNHSLLTEDWTNGYQIKNLPFSGKTMTN